MVHGSKSVHQGYVVSFFDLEPSHVGIERSPESPQYLQGRCKIEKNWRSRMGDFRFSSPSINSERDFCDNKYSRTRTLTSQKASRLRSSSQLACQRSQGVCARVPEYLLAEDKIWCHKHARFLGKLLDEQDRSRRSGCVGKVQVRKVECFPAVDDSMKSAI